MVPAEALIFNRDGLQVAVVNNGKAEIRKVRVTRDLGTRVEVDAGVKPGEKSRHWKDRHYKRRT
jgi:hypothetical protein